MDQHVVSLQFSIRQIEIEVMTSLTFHPHGQAAVVVVIVPLPAQGHLNQLLQLSHLITSYNIPLHFVGSISHNRQAKLRAHASHPESSNPIQFRDFQLSQLQTPDDDTYLDEHPKLPSHFIPVFKAAFQLRKPTFELLRTLSSDYKRVVIIHDSLMGSVVQDLQSLPNSESYTFHTISAFALFFYLWEQSGMPFHLSPDIPKGIPPNKECFTSNFMDFIAEQNKYLSLSTGRLYNTCRSTESKYIDLLAKLPFNSNKKHYAIGPLNPVAASSKHRHRCLEWLDDQPPNTVLYVSFGTTTSLSDEQTKELAVGLEKSEQRFIWALRDADKGDVLSPEEARREQLPEGFEERARTRGMVVRDWAPQVEILGHRATGGFMSHCGWNSCMESMSMGVPMAAWPMHSDQPKNAVLVTEVLRVCVTVKEWESRNMLVTASMVEKAVRRLMESEEGEEMRRRASDIAGEVGESVATRREMDSFIAHICR